MKNILITGANGFLGSHLIKRLLGNEEYQVYAITSNEEGLRKKLSGTSRKPHIIHNSKIQSITQSDIDICVNCAFPRSMEEGQLTSKGLDLVTDILGLEAAGGVGAIINVSSQSLYGESRSYCADEFSPIILDSKYAVGKFMMEKMTNIISKDTAHTNIRLASLIGEGFDQRIVNKLADGLLKNGRIEIIKSKRKFGFLDINDAVSAFEYLIGSDSEQWQEIYNVGIENGYDLNEIAKTVVNEGSRHGVNGEVIINTDVEDSVFKTSEICSKRFEEQFGWYPNCSLEATVDRIFRSKVSPYNGNE